MSKRKRELYQNKCLECGGDDFSFTTTLQIVHDMGVKTLKEVFGGESQIYTWGKKTNEIVNVGWNEFGIPFLENETHLDLKIECVKCGSVIPNKIYSYSLSPKHNGVVIQAEVKTKLK